MGHYINNYTISCDLPPPQIQPTPFNELRIVVEISLNGGIDSTTDGLQFTYRHKDVMNFIYPERGFTFGNTYLTIGFSYFYDRTLLFMSN